MTTHTMQTLRDQNRASTYILLILLVAFVFFGSPPSVVDVSDEPVVGLLEVTAEHPAEAGFMFSAEAMKWSKAGWQRTEFWIDGAFGEGSLITANPHLDPPVGRPVGLQKWDRIFIPGIDREDFEGRVWGYAYHYCRGADGPLCRSPFWVPLGVNG